MTNVTRLTCSMCNAHLCVPEKKASQVLKCPKCGGAIVPQRVPDSGIDGTGNPEAEDLAFSFLSGEAQSGVSELRPTPKIGGGAGSSSSNPATLSTATQVTTTSAVVPAPKSTGHRIGGPTQGQMPLARSRRRLSMTVAAVCLAITIICAIKFVPMGQSQKQPEGDNLAVVPAAILVNQNGADRVRAAEVAMREGGFAEAAKLLTPIPTDENGRPSERATVLAKELQIVLSQEAAQKSIRALSDSELLTALDSDDFSLPAGSEARMSLSAISEPQLQSAYHSLLLRFAGQEAENRGCVLLQEIEFSIEDGNLETAEKLLGRYLKLPGATQKDVATLLARELRLIPSREQLATSLQQLPLEFVDVFATGGEAVNAPGRNVTHPWLRVAFSNRSQELAVIELQRREKIARSILNSLQNDAKASSLFLSREGKRIRDVRVSEGVNATEAASFLRALGYGNMASDMSAESENGESAAPSARQKVLAEIGEKYIRGDWLGNRFDSPYIGRPGMMRAIRLTETVMLNRMLPDFDFNQYATEDLEAVLAVLRMFGSAAIFSGLPYEAIGNDAADVLKSGLSEHSIFAARSKSAERRIINYLLGNSFSGRSFSIYTLQIVRDIHRDFGRGALTRDAAVQYNLLLSRPMISSTTLTAEAETLVEIGGDWIPDGTPDGAEPVTIASAWAAYKVIVAKERFENGQHRPPTRRGSRKVRAP